MSNRTVRINELLQREISQVLHTRHRSESVLVTISHVEIAPDLRTARVFFSLLKKDADVAATRLWLQSLIPDIARHLSKHVQLRYLPKLEFIHDETPDRAERIYRLLDDLDKPSSPQP